MFTLPSPPLYKAKRGNSVLYLKDDREMEDYLIRGGCDDAILARPSGEQVSGRRSGFAGRTKPQGTRLNRRVKQDGAGENH